MRKASESRWVQEPTELALDMIPTAPPKRANKEREKDETERLAPRLEAAFDKLNFAGVNGLLLVLQGMDAAGKDGAIRHILKHCHAQSARVASFGVPSEVEAAHDFLWRVHARTPARGEFVLFNRSHYEDVVVTRVNGSVDGAEAERRFARIREFERLLIESGTIVLKAFLHISPEEQEERLLEREKEPDAAWKLSAGDWRERLRWDAYQRAYEAAIGATATPDAPWIVVPADKKWHRDRVLTEALLKTLEPRLPAWDAELARLGQEKRAELAAYRREAAEAPQ